MTFEIVYGEKGRGAWPSTGKGGTLTADGKAYGRYYRKKYYAKGWVSQTKNPGKVGADAVEDNIPVGIDYYAVYKAVQGFQRWTGAEVTGVFDAQTKDAVIAWQNENNLVPDGIFGPATARKLIEPVIISEAKKIDSEHAVLGALGVGFCNWESGWDLGAVGGVTPEDLGLFQINGPSHPSMSVDQRLTPLPSIRYALGLIESNLTEFEFDVDAAIAAYNLGKGGARQWIAAGRPDVWVRTVNGVERTTDVRRYINEIKKGAGLPV